MEPIAMPKMKPSIYVSDKDLPAIKTWKIGEEYEMIVKVKMTSVSTHEGAGTNATLEVQDFMIPEDDRKVSEMNDSDFMEHMAETKRKQY